MRVRLCYLVAVATDPFPRKKVENALNLEIVRVCYHRGQDPNSSAPSACLIWRSRMCLRVLSSGTWDIPATTLLGVRESTQMVCNKLTFNRSSTK